MGFTLFCFVLFKIGSEWPKTWNPLVSIVLSAGIEPDHNLISLHCVFYPR